MRKFPSLYRLLLHCMLEWQSFANVSVALDIPIYFGVLYPLSGRAPIVECFIIEDGKLRLRSVRVDTDGDFVLDSSIVFDKTKEPEVISLINSKDPFGGQISSCIKAEKKEAFDAVRKILKNGEGKEIQIHFVNHEGYFLPEHPDNARCRGSAAYQSFSTEPIP